MSEQTVTALFCDLVQIPSPSGHERAVAEFIAEWLARHGVASQADETGSRTGSDSGNLIATIEGAPDGPRLLFVSHMDTVEPPSGETITPEITQVGRALDYIPRDPKPPELAHFGMLHGLYSVLDLLKLVLGFWMAAALVRLSPGE